MHLYECTSLIWMFTLNLLSYSFNDWFWFAQILSTWICTYVKGLTTSVDEKLQISSLQSLIIIFKAWIPMFPNKLVDKSQRENIL